MDQLICAALSQIHYWYEVGMLKVPVVDASQQSEIISRGNRVLVHHRRGKRGTRSEKSNRDARRSHTSTQKCRQ